ncbi:MAG: hypothetical protein ACK40K_02695, partial [Raineya sp.]
MQANLVKEEVHHSPSYYVRKRFFSNYTAVAGLVVVILAVLVATLGYLIMPDHTPRRGFLTNTQPGLRAQQEREAEARTAIDEAMDYAAVIGAGAAHVMAGF